MRFRNFIKKPSVVSSVRHCGAKCNQLQKHTQIDIQSPGFGKWFKVWQCNVCGSRYGEEKET